MKRITLTSTVMVVFLTLLGPAPVGRASEPPGPEAVARRYAQLAGLKATCLTFLSGEETAWSNHAFRGTTSFVVELPAGPVLPDALARHLRAVRAMELGQRVGSPTHCDSITGAA